MCQGGTSSSGCADGGGCGIMDGGRGVGACTARSVRSLTCSDAFETCFPELSARVSIKSSSFFLISHSSSCNCALLFIMFLIDTFSVVDGALASPRGGAGVSDGGLEVRGLWIRDKSHPHNMTCVVWSHPSSVQVSRQYLQCQ